LKKTKPFTIPQARFIIHPLCEGSVLCTPGGISEK
jgi:hypothetical protein